MARDALRDGDRVWYVGPEDGASPRVFPRSGLRMRNGQPVEAGVYLAPTLIAVGSTGKVTAKAYGCVQVNWGDGNVQWCPRTFLASYAEFNRKRDAGAGVVEKPPVGPVRKLEPEGVCLAGPLYEHFHGPDGLKWDSEKQEYPRCPYCIVFMPNSN